MSVGDVKVKHIGMRLAEVTREIVFAASLEEYKRLVEQEDWLPLYTPRIGEHMGIKAEIWIAYKELSISGGSKGGSSDSQANMT